MDLNIRPETLEVMQERAGNTLELMSIGSDLLNRTQMAQQLTESIENWHYMKLKSFCRTKKMVSKLKRLPTEWKKIFANYTSDKGLITRIYKGAQKTKLPQNQLPIEEMGKRTD
jgi:hypothetical protein